MIENPSFFGKIVIFTMVNRIFTVLFHFWEILDFDDFSRFLTIFLTILHINRIEMDIQEKSKKRHFCQKSPKFGVKKS